MVCCICSCSGEAEGFGFLASVGCDGSCAESAVLMIFTSSPDVALVAAVPSVASAGAIGGFVITGLGAAGVARLWRLFRRVWASPSARQKLTTRQTATMSLM